MISVRRTDGLPQTSFRFYLTADTLVLLAMCFPLTGALRTFTFKINARAGRTSSRRRLLPPTSHTTVHTVRYTAVQLTWHFIKYSSADNRPNFESRAFDIAKQMDSFRQTLAYPCVHAALAAFPLLIPSFIRFLSRFLGVFQCFHIHIRNLYRMIASSLRVTLRISPILK